MTLSALVPEVETPGDPQTNDAHVLLLYAYGNSTRDAVANAVRQLAKGLTTAGYETSVLSLKQASKRRQSRAVRAVDQCWYLLKVATALIVRLRSIDVIVTIDVPTGIGFLGWMARWLSGGRIHHIGWVLDLYQFQPGGPHSPAQRLRRWADRSSLSKAEYLVTIGECMATVLERATQRDATVVPMWQDEDWLTPSSMEWREQFNLASEELLVLYSGNAADHHPLGNLIEAIALANVHAPVRLVIAGQGQEYLRQKARVKRERIEHVHFLEPSPYDIVPDMLTSADVHVISLSSGAEGTCVPSKTYAAMAVGRPCLFLGPVTSQAAIDIRAADGGLVVSGDDVQEISNALVRFSKEPAERKAAGANGRDFFLRERSLSTQTRAWATFIHSILDESKNGAHYAETR